MRSHQSLSASNFHRGFERRQNLVKEGLGIDRGRGKITTARDLTVAGEMFRRRDNVIGVGLSGGATLQPGDGRNAHLGGEVGVFAKRFFNTTPAGITAQIEHRGVGFVGAARARFAGGDIERLLDQGGVPARCHG